MCPLGFGGYFLNVSSTLVFSKGKTEHNSYTEKNLDSVLANLPAILFWGDLNHSVSALLDKASGCCSLGTSLNSIDQCSLLNFPYFWSRQWNLSITHSPGAYVMKSIRPWLIWAVLRPGRLRGGVYLNLFSKRKYATMTDWPISKVQIREYQRIFTSHKSWTKRHRE